MLALARFIRIDDAETSAELEQLLVAQGLQIEPEERSVWTCSATSPGVAAPSRPAVSTS
jgi:hypothetical protein